MSTRARIVVSEEEFLRLPEINSALELVDGEVVRAPGPSYWHQEVLGRLVRALRSWADGAGIPDTVAQAPLDVRFGPGRILQPDAMVFLAQLERDVDMPIQRNPEVCVEVLSSDRVYDRISKRFLYAQAGVREYWLVEPAGMIERCSGPGLAASELCEERLHSEVLPGLELDLEPLFR